MYICNVYENNLYLMGCVCNALQMYCYVMCIYVYVIYLYSVCLYVMCMHDYRM